jgi:hypothetical protein
MGMTHGLHSCDMLGPMKMLRLVHLYLGCMFAPLLVFFAVSGVVQRFWSEITQHFPEAFVGKLALLDTLHTGRALKLGGNLSSGLMTVFVVLMALSLVFTLLLGILMAFRFGHRRSATICLALGFVIPLVVTLLTMTPSRELPNKPLQPAAPSGRGPS